MIYFVVTLGAVSITTIAGLIFQNWLHMKERTQLLSRIMAKSLEEYEYYEKMFKGEVKELKDRRDDLNKEDKEIEEVVDSEYEKEAKFVEELDMGIKPEDVDLKKIRDMIGND